MHSLDTQKYYSTRSYEYCLNVTIDTVEVLQNYNAEEPDELTLCTGDIIKICRRLRGGWSKGEFNGRHRIFHEFFVKKELMVSIKLAHIKGTVHSYVLLSLYDCHMM